jgi:putative aminopeptidase FrvX
MAAPDIARFVAAALSLSDWPEKLIIQGDRLTLNEAVAVAESVKGTPMDNRIGILCTMDRMLTERSTRLQIQCYLHLD